jgi:hypothetical protein
VDEIINLQPLRNKAKSYQVKQVRNLFLNYRLEIELNALRTHHLLEQGGQRLPRLHGRRPIRRRVFPTPSHNPSLPNHQPQFQSSKPIMQATVEMKKEQRGHMATRTAATAATNAAAKLEFTAAEKNACSIDPMLNGGECEACQ